MALSGGSSVTRTWTIDATWRNSRSVPRRVVFSDTVLNNLATGVWDYTISAGVVYQGLPEKWTPPISAKLLTINRKTNPFGAGWDIAGLERLTFLQAENGYRRILWTSGNGSGHVYRQDPADTTRYAGPSVVRPDTLVFRAADVSYVRVLPGGDTVRFNFAGKHVETRNRLGYSTRFFIGATEKPDSIVLPGPSGAASKKYVFTYPNANKIVISAPSVAGQLRKDTIYIQNSVVPRVFYIAGAAGRDTFAYVNNNRIIRHDNRLRNRTNFAFDGNSGAVAKRNARHGGNGEHRSHVHGQGRPWHWADASPGQ